MIGKLIKEHISELVLMAVISAAIWLLSNLRNTVMFIGLYSAFMWLNITISVTVSALLNNPVDEAATVYRWVYIIIAAACLSVCII